MNIGYIGLGALGGQLARRLLGAWPLVVWDHRPEAAEALRPLGAQPVATALELAQRSDVVMLCLPRSSDVRQVLFGPSGLAAGLRPGQLVIDQTSGVPGDTEAMARELAARGVAMIDAAVSASPQLVLPGKAVLMVGGSEQAWQQAQPVLQAITPQIHRCGERVGDGQAMKTLNNAMNCSKRMGTLELVLLGRKAGASLATLTAALDQGASANITTERMLHNIAKGVASTDFALALQIKDTDQALALGTSHGVAMPIVTAARTLLQAGLSLRGPQTRIEEMISVIEQLGAGRIAGEDSAAAPSGFDADEVVRLVQQGVSTLNRLITRECLGVGLARGLALGTMAAVWQHSSGWSGASREMLGAWAAGRAAPEPAPGQTLAALDRIVELAAACAAPVSELGIARAVLRLGLNPDPLSVLASRQH